MPYIKFTKIDQWYDVICYDNEELFLFSLFLQDTGWNVDNIISFFNGDSPQNSLCMNATCFTVIDEVVTIEYESYVYEEDDDESRFQYQPFIISKKQLF